jgi:hypothetical protein
MLLLISLFHVLVAAPVDELSFQGIPIDNSAIAVSVTPIKAEFQQNEPVVVRIVYRSLRASPIMMSEQYPRAINIGFQVPERYRLPYDQALIGSKMPRRRMTLAAGEEHVRHFCLNEIATYPAGNHSLSFSSMVHQGGRGEDDPRMFLRSFGEFNFQVSDTLLTEDELQTYVADVINNPALSDIEKGYILYWIQHADAAKKCFELTLGHKLPLDRMIMAIRTYSNGDWITAQQVGQIIRAGDAEELREGLIVLHQRQDEVPREVVEWVVKSHTTYKPKILVEHYLKYRVRDHMDLVQQLRERDDKELRVLLNRLLSRSL